MIWGIWVDELEKIRKRKLGELKRRYSEKKEEATDESIQITDQIFDDTIKKHPIVVVDLWAPWCMPCLATAPTIEELAKKYAGKIVFGKLNIDENKSTPVKFAVMGIPTLLFFKNGKLVDRIIGAVPKDHIEWKLEKILGN